MNLAFWLAESLRFSWAFLTSPSIEVFSVTKRVIFSWSDPIVLFMPSI